MHASRWALEQTNPNLGPWVSALDEQFDEEAIAQEADQVAARAAALEAEMARDAAAARWASAWCRDADFSSQSCSPRQRQRAPGGAWARAGRVQEAAAAHQVAAAERQLCDALECTCLHGGSCLVAAKFTTKLENRSKAATKRQQRPDLQRKQGWVLFVGES